MERHSPSPFITLASHLRSDGHGTVPLRRHNRRCRKHARLHQPLARQRVGFLRHSFKTLRRLVGEPPGHELEPVGASGSPGVFDRTLECVPGGSCTLERNRTPLNATRRHANTTQRYRHRTRRYGDATRRYSNAPTRTPRRGLRSGHRLQTARGGKRHSATLGANLKRQLQQDVTQLVRARPGHFELPSLDAAVRLVFREREDIAVTLWPPLGEKFQGRSYPH